MSNPDDNEPLTREWFRERQIDITTSFTETLAATEAGLISVELVETAPCRTVGEFRKALSERQQKAGKE